MLRAGAGQQAVSGCAMGVFHVVILLDVWGGGSHVYKSLLLDGIDVEPGRSVFSAEHITEKGIDVDVYLDARLENICESVYFLYRNPITGYIHWVYGSRHEGDRGNDIYNRCKANNGENDGTFHRAYVAEREFETRAMHIAQNKGDFRLLTLVFVDDENVPVPHYDAAMEFSTTIRRLSDEEADGRVTFYEATGGWGSLQTDEIRQFVRLAPEERDHSRFKSKEADISSDEAEKCREIPVGEDEPLMVTPLCRRYVGLDVAPHVQHHGQHSHSH